MFWGKMRTEIKILYKKQHGVFNLYSQTSECAMPLCLHVLEDACTFLILYRLYSLVYPLAPHTANSMDILRLLHQLS